MIRFVKTSFLIPKIASTLFLILFVYAATSKLLDFDAFRIQLGQSPILTAYADGVVWGLPLLELGITGLFLVPRFTLLAFYASYALMVMFTTYIFLILNFSDFIPCSCGGVLEKLGWTEHIVFNIAFIAIAVLGILFSRDPRTLKSVAL